MKRISFVSVLMLGFALAGTAQTTLDECQEAARRNYPQIRQYDLLRQTTQFTLQSIRKGWLPQVSATAQATLQSDVASWPGEMQGMLSQMGIQMEGLKRDQYKVGIDVNQLVYDGGSIKAQQEVARQQGEVQEAQTDVALYAVRQRVNDLFFGVLLADERILLLEDMQELFRSSEDKLSSMYKHGTAALSDYNNVRAERLDVEQQIVSLRSQRQSLLSVLSAFCGQEISQVARPPMVDSGTGNNRPELRLIDSQLQLLDKQQQLLNVRLRPKVSLFASGFYGYPGYNMFEDMRHREFSLNGMVGARITWNFGQLYTHKSDSEQLQTQRSLYEVQRETFLFNNRLEQLQASEEVNRYRQLLRNDAEIIALRTSIRQAAESKLVHGIIDVNDLIREINNENAAKLQQSIHEIELLKELYDQKIISNN